MGKAGVLPTHKARRGADPKAAIARDQQLSNIAALKRCTRQRQPGSFAEPIEPQEAEFRPQPKITVRCLSDCLDRAIEEAVTDRPGGMRVLAEVQRRI